MRSVFFDEVRGDRPTDDVEKVEGEEKQGLCVDHEAPEYFVSFFSV